MRWTITEWRVLVRGVSSRYRRSRKQEKGRILDDLKNLSPVYRMTGEPDPEQAIPGVENGPLSGSLESIQLVTESQILENQVSAVWKQ